MTIIPSSECGEGLGAGVNKKKISRRPKADGFRHFSAFLVWSIDRNRRHRNQKCCHLSCETISRKNAQTPRAKVTSRPFSDIYEPKRHLPAEKEKKSQLAMGDKQAARFEFHEFVRCLPGAGRGVMSSSWVWLSRERKQQRNRRIFLKLFFPTAEKISRISSTQYVSITCSRDWQAIKTLFGSLSEGSGWVMQRSWERQRKNLSTAPGPGSLIFQAIIAFVSIKKNTKTWKERCLGANKSRSVSLRSLFVYFIELTSSRVLGFSHFFLCFVFSNLAAAEWFGGIKKWTPRMKEDVKHQQTKAKEIFFGSFSRCFAIVRGAAGGQKKSSKVLSAPIYGKKKFFMLFTVIGRLIAPGALNFNCWTRLAKVSDIRAHEMRLFVRLTED